MDYFNTSEENESRSWNTREQSLDEVKKKLRLGWRNDPKVLNQYFQSCYLNWKVYKGDRTPKQTLKLQAIYKQAIYGDNEDPMPNDLTTVEGEKWKAWERLKGMSKEMAKRRFITFLTEINPILIDVMPDEKPPPGFPLDRKGNPICAKCNTMVGCARPLLDQNKMVLKNQLFENDEFHEPEKLKVWIRNAIANQRCIWGMHQPIPKADAKPFMDWFNREENRGFFPYDSISLMRIVRDLVHQYHEVTYELMQKKEEVGAAVYNQQATKTLKIKEIFEQFSGETFVFELPCTKDNDNCNHRRIVDGGKNHKHEIKIDPPTATDANTMEEAIILRTQCQKLGINPSTGIVKSLEERCTIYRKRIAEHFEALKKAAEAKIRNENRADIHKKQKKEVTILSKTMVEKQCWEACNMNLIDNIMTLLQRGADPNEESNRGITPLICFVINEVNVERIEDIIKLKADVNKVNKYGFTPLMMACRLQDIKMVHVLMRSGASALTKGKNGQSALHICVHHTSEELVKVLVDYLKEGVGDALRVTRFLDAIDDDGESALIAAAKIRNGIMCHLLTSLGANPNNRNSSGRTAAYIARSLNWSEISDWLEKKVSAGAMKVETYSDLQFEKQSRYGMIKMKDLLKNFGKGYLTLIQNRVSLYPLGCPFKIQQMVEDRGRKALEEQQQFVDNHQRFILNRHVENYMTRALLNHNLQKIVIPQIDPQQVQESKESLRNILSEMLSLLRQGWTYPNTEVPAQPLPWTPLMCAVSVNEIRSAKLMVREGASPNHPNRDGTTPVMLAAQLQHVEMLIELLELGGDLNQVDNQGYNALAYATVLPLPTIMSRDVIETLLNDDLGGPKLLNTAQIIKCVIAGGLEDIKTLIEKNYKEAAPNKLERHMQLVRLLEKYGLTAIENENNLHRQIDTAFRRVSEDVSAMIPKFQIKRNNDILVENSEEDVEDDEFLLLYELEAKEKFKQEEIKRKKEEEEANRLAADQLRCPICTLAIPCAHFFKIQSLLSFIEQNEKGKSNEVVTTVTKSKDNIKFTKKFKVKNRNQEILEETQLDDRKFDRSALLAKKYQEKETQIFIDRKKRMAMKEGMCEPELLNEEPEILEEPPFNTINDPSLAIENSKEQPLEKVMNNLENEKDLSLISLKNDEVIEPSNELVPFNENLDQALVPILRRTPGPSRKGRRVKFDLPLNDEELALQQAEEDQRELEEKLAIEAAEHEKVKEEKEKQVTMALSVLSEGKIIHKDDDIPSGIRTPRRVILFTQDRLGSTKDGISLLSPPPKASPRVNPPKPSTSPKTVISSKIHLSGWLFTHLTTIQSNVRPIESISISQEGWVDLLNEINNSLHNHWNDEMHMNLLINVKDWKIVSPRCSLCCIGYVRSKASVRWFQEDPHGYTSSAKQTLQLILTDHQTSDPLSKSLMPFICLQCLIRRELYENLLQKTSKTFRKSLSSRWPFLPISKVSSNENQISDSKISNVEENHEQFDNIEDDASDLGLQGVESQSSIDSLTFSIPSVLTPQTSVLPSPIASHKLFRIDSFHESNPKNLSIEEFFNSEPFLDPEDLDNASQSSLSQLSMYDSSVDTNSLSTVSTISVVDPLKKPKEMTLLPFLIAKGNFHDAERTVRIAIGKKAVDEGEGMYLLLRILNLQADMYKYMGLWALAFAIHLDIADMLATLLGMNDYLTLKAIGLVANCLRKMHSPEQAENYIKHCKVILTSGLRRSSKTDLVEQLKGINDQNTKQFIRQNGVWVHYIQRLIKSLGSNVLRQRFHHTYGLPGLFSLLTAESGALIVSRRAFYSFCQLSPKLPSHICLYSQFVDSVFRLKICDDEEISRHILRNLLQKSLAKSLISTSEVAKKFREITSQDKIETIIQFLHNGIPLSSDVFDEMLYYSLQVLLPIYRTFIISSEEGEIFRESSLNIIAEIYDCSASMIQCQFRRLLAINRVKKRMLSSHKVNSMPKLSFYQTKFK